jgi:hypothetical protein
MAGKAAGGLGELRYAQTGNFWMHRAFHARAREA